MAASSSNTLRAVLKERGWSRTRLVAELRRQAASRGESLPGTESLIAMVSRWVNNHQQPSDFYRDLLARTLGRPRTELFSDEAARLELAAEAEPWLLARALEASSVGQAALEALEEAVGEFARAARIQATLASEQLEAPAVVAAAYGQVVAAAVAVIASLTEQPAGLEAALTAVFCAHPDAGIVRSQPGLGLVLAARVLAEFGDDPNRYASARARKAYAGTAPITRASGLRQVVLARAVGNRRLSTACHLWAFAALTGSPGARRYYDAHRARGASHHQALRVLANRLVGILHGCLRHRRPYDEQLAWPASTAGVAA